MALLARRLHTKFSGVLLGVDVLALALPHRTGVAAPTVLAAVRVLRGRALLRRVEDGVPTSRSFPTCPRGPSTAELQLQGAVLSLLLHAVCGSTPGWHGDVPDAPSSSGDAVFACSHRFCVCSLVACGW